MLGDNARQVDKKLKIGILTTGNEVLLAKTNDTNGGYIAKAFESIGCQVIARHTCGDYEEHLLDALGFLAQHCDAIIMTGGLGPTSDDLTASVIAKFFNRPVCFSQQAWDICVTAFRRMGRAEIPETNKKQAELPQGCEIFENPFGTAAGFLTSGIVKQREIQIFALPGVPKEMEPMLKTNVLPRFVVAGAQTLRHVWQVFMLGESKLQAMVDELEKDLKDKFPSAHISYQAHSLWVTYSVFFQEVDQQLCNDFEKYINDFGQKFESILGSHILYRGSESLSQKTQCVFSEKKQTLATAESCTGGWLAKELTSVSGASRYFLGGAVTYANEVKVEMLGVKSESLSQWGAVSHVVAGEMAMGILTKLNSSVGVGISGIAGPHGGSAEKPVGLVYFGVSINKKSISNFENLKNHMKILGFEELQKSNSCYTLTCERKFGNRQREQIQTLSSQFMLGALVVVAEYLA